MAAAVVVAVAEPHKPHEPYEQPPKPAQSDGEDYTSVVLPFFIFIKGKTLTGPVVIIM